MIARMMIESPYNYMTWQVVEEYIPKRQLMYYRNKFRCFDRRKTGVLPMEDVVLIFKQIGHNITVADLERVLRDVIGVDFRHISARVVDFQEFIAIMSFIASNCVDEDEMHLVFRQFDIDGDGYITTEELRAMLSRLGDKITDAELAEMMKAADTDGDGKVSYQEFVRVMTGSCDVPIETPSKTDSELSAKDLNMDELSAEINTIAEQQFETEPGKMCEISRRRSKDDTDDVFMKRPVKYMRSRFSIFSGKRKSSDVLKKKIEARNSCPAVLGSYDLRGIEQKTNMERTFSSSAGASIFRLGTFKRRSKRNSQ